MATKKKAATKAGSSAGSKDHRRRLFVDAYIANGGNAKQAAIAAGYAESRAEVTGSELVKDRKVQEEITRRRAELEQQSGLTAERVLREIARIVYFDPRELFREDGSLKPTSEWTDDQAAAIASIEISDGKTRVKAWDKNAALEKAMKHLGLYEKDNQQKGSALSALLAEIDGTSRGLP